MTLTLVASQYFSTLGGRFIRCCVSIHSTFIANGTLYGCTLLQWDTISTLPTPRALMLFVVCSITNKGGEIFLHLGTRLHSIVRQCTEIVCLWARRITANANNKYSFLYLFCLLIVAYLPTESHYGRQSNPESHTVALIFISFPVDVH